MDDPGQHPARTGRHPHAPARITPLKPKPAGASTINIITEFFRSRARSFRYAFAGWWHVIRTQKNAWIHTVVSVAVLVLALWLQIAARDFAVLILTIALVWTSEFINTAVEAVVDLASPGIHPLARIGKDVGAAAVLIAALAAILVGLLIMGPPLWERVAGMLGAGRP